MEGFRSIVGAGLAETDPAGGTGLFLEAISEDNIALELKATRGVEAVRGERVGAGREGSILALALSVPEAAGGDIEEEVGDAGSMSQ